MALWACRIARMDRFRQSGRSFAQEIRFAYCRPAAASILWEKRIAKANLPYYGQPQLWNDDTHEPVGEISCPRSRNPASRILTGAASSS
jgi:hypothetical protein